MKHKFKGIINELNVRILQCDEGIAWLNDEIVALAEDLHVINAMVPFVGAKAKGCNLKKEGLKVHLHVPSTMKDTCALYCGELDCGAALTYMSHAKDNIKKHCRNVVYLQGGALCFVEKQEPLHNFAECEGIVQPHKPGGLSDFIKDMNADRISCDQADSEITKLKSASGSHYVWNTMIPVFGARAKVCDLAGVTVHSDAPTSDHDLCMLYCGEDSCPYTLQHVAAKKMALARHCKKLAFLEGGAKCFLEKVIPMESDEDCRNIVDPEA